MKRQFKVLDLFAGGGGFSTGFLLADHPDASFTVVKAVEINEDAAKTLVKHLGADKVLCGDLTKPEVKERLIQECIEQKVDVIIGGPPCQTFSLAGPARSGKQEMRDALKDDERNTLYKHFLDIVDKISPHYVVFENVEGILSKKVEVTPDLLSSQERLAIELVCEDLEEIGYNSRLAHNPNERFMVLNATNYGVPQQRKRVIIIANKHDRLNPSPEKTHGDEEGLQPFVTIQDAISDLPIVLPKIHHTKARTLKNMNVILNHFHDSLKLFIDSLSHIAVAYSENPIAQSLAFQDLVSYSKQFLEEYPNRNEKLEDLLNEFIIGYNSRAAKVNELAHSITPSSTHVSRAHNIRDLVIFSKMEPGTSSAQFMNKQMSIYNEFLDQLYPYDKGKHVDTYVKHSWNKPSNTILSHMEKDGLKFIHPDQPRSFTPYEAALLQSFPPDYEFCGKRNAQYRQIGNAVPPKMSQKIAEALLNVLVAETEEIVHTM